MQKPATFTLAVVASLDGFIARYPGDAPQNWASAEEQEIFFAEVEAADWSIMGRGTHEAADKPHRRRIIFSSSGGPGTWRRPTQLWLDPAHTSPDALGERVADVHPLNTGLVLGGTRVHDWFHAARRLDRILLTVEPIRFGTGLPIFTDQRRSDPVEVFLEAGYAVTQDETLNNQGTRLVTLCPSP